MYEIKEYCDRINYKKPDIFELCKQNDLFSPTAKSLADLTDEEMEKYQREVRFHYDSYRNTWKNILQDSM